MATESALQSAVPRTEQVAASISPLIPTNAAAKAKTFVAPKVSLY